MTEPPKTRCGDCKHLYPASKRTDKAIGCCHWAKGQSLPFWLSGDPYKFASENTPCATFEARGEEGASHV